MQASHEDPLIDPDLSDDDYDYDDDDDDDDDDDTEHYEEAKIKELRPDKKENIAEGVFEWTFSIYPQRKTRYAQQEEKIIMVVGATGKGKSALINRMMNHILCVKYTDAFRYQLVTEKKSQTRSQKRNITIYTFKVLNLTIIDTPGIGDTAGKQEDQKTIQKIQNLFTSGSIKTIHAICFVVKHNDVCLDPSICDVFQTIAELFDNDTAKNIFVMATCCDVIYIQGKIEKPPVIRLFRKAGIPYKAYFSFNNKHIYKQPETSGRMFSREQDDWETSAISFDCFFDKVTKASPVKLELSIEIVQKRRNITHAQLPEFARKLKDGIHAIDEHKENLRVIKKEIENPGKDFTYEVEIEKTTMEDIQKPGIFCTMCKNCDKVCHYPCDIKKDSALWWCDTMSWWWFSYSCTSCPKKCSWKDHTRDTKRPIRRTYRVIRTLEDLKQKYLKEKGESRDNLIKLIEYEMVSTYAFMLKDLKAMQGCISLINKTSLSKHHTNLEEYMNGIIKDEKKIRKMVF